MNKGFMDNFYNTGIRITKDAGQPAVPVKDAATEKSKNRLNLKNMRIEKIPFRLFLVPTILLLYIGIVMIDRAKVRKKP